ncbi:MAG: D-glycero-beta-D-manno-heptose 1-phosphate adenylyltransferase, partial [Desulfobacteraceae bacterium]|nr:D-glycero-beta-D-manno-heptose 1-phosphate adenylyltransferase [Desulfobacteraceae bacterium]
MMFVNKDKIVTKDRMSLLANDYKKGNKQIVFTNGCFDILHAGHVAYLTEAAQLGDILVLGLNSDVSVKIIKGEKRPVINEDHRAQVVAGLECIDHVVLFDDPDPEDLIKTICPDVLVKGSDWPEDAIVGADFVKHNGGQVHRVKLEPGISTTKIIQRIG